MHFCTSDRPIGWRVCTTRGFAQAYTQRFWAATRVCPLVLWHAVECHLPGTQRLVSPGCRRVVHGWVPYRWGTHIRESWIKTEPAGASTCSSPGIGAVTVMPSRGPRGLRVSRCAPGTHHVPPEVEPASIMYQTICAAAAASSEDLERPRNGSDGSCCTYAEAHADVGERLPDRAALHSARPLAPVAEVVGPVTAGRAVSD